MRDRSRTFTCLSFFLRARLAISRSTRQRETMEIELILGDMSDRLLYKREKKLHRTRENFDEKRRQESSI